MPLVHCPECGHEVSLNAVSCPNCGRPIAAPAAERKVVIAPPARSEGGVPPWVFVAIGALAIALFIFGLILFRQSEDQANLNVNVNRAPGKTASEPLRDSRTVSVPSTSDPNAPVTPSQTTAVPGTATSAPVAPPPNKGTVVINAKIAPATGAAQAARNTKFYLLDKDVDTILNEARIEPIEGNSLASSLGLAAVFPDRYGDFQRRAMRAIAAHAKFSGTTGAGGSANLTGIDPDQYYLFAIVRVGRGFALWNSPISVSAGENVLNLSPQDVTEISDANG